MLCVVLCSLFFIDACDCAPSSSSSLSFSNCCVVISDVFCAFSLVSCEIAMCMFFH